MFLAPTTVLRRQMLLQLLSFFRFQGSRMLRRQVALAPTGVISADNFREWADKVNLKIDVVAKSKLGKLH